MTARTAELLRIMAEGRAAAVGASNPYHADLSGSIVSAAVWRMGYKQMIEERMRTSPARQAFLRAQAQRSPSLSPCTLSRSEFITPPDCASLS